MRMGNITMPIPPQQLNMIDDPARLDHDPAPFLLNAVSHRWHEKRKESKKGVGYD